MSVLIERLSISRFAAVRRVSSETLARAKSFAASLMRRREIYDLSRLDDRMLADMGVTRGDLAEASRWSLWGDPGDRLTELASERRAARGRLSQG